MLETIRKRQKSLFILLALGVIILVFVFWGAGPSGPGLDPNVVATVDGEDILLRDYVNLYKRNLEYMRAITGGAPDIEKDMDLKRDTVNILINRALALAEAERKGVRATGEEVQRAIMAMEPFQKDGRFDKELYFQVLNENRIKTKDFEEGVAKDIATEKVRYEAFKDVAVSEKEVEEAYRKLMRKIDIKYASFDPAAFAGKVQVTDDEARAFLRESSSNFIVPVKIKAGYVYADYADFSRKVKVTEDEVNGYYEKSRSEFIIPEKIRASHILIRAEEGDKDKAKKKAEELLEMVRRGESFERLARLHSADPGSAKAGGDLGYFPRGMMIKSFEDAAFALKKGEVSGIVESEFGYHIIKVTDRKEEGLTPLKDAEASIRRTLLGEKARDEAYKAIESLRSSFQKEENQETLKKLSRESGLPFSITPSFSEEDIDAAVPAVEEFRDIAFLLKKGEVSRPVKTHAGVYLFKVVEREEAYLPEYEKISSRVKEKLVAVKAKDAASAKSKEFLEALKKGEDLDALARKEGVRAESTGFFTRSGLIPKIGAFAGEDEKLFELSKEKPVYDEVLAHNNRFYVIAWKGTKEADPSGLAPLKEDLTQRLLAEKQEEAVDAWLKDLRTKAKIKVFEERL